MEKIDVLALLNFLTVTKLEYQFYHGKKQLSSS